MYKDFTRKYFYSIFCSIILKEVEAQPEPELEAEAEAEPEPEAEAEAVPAETISVDPDVVTIREVDDKKVKNVFRKPFVAYC